MPIYEYHCKNCSHNFDLYKSLNEYSSEELCPKCNQKANRVWTTISKDWFRPHWNEHLDTNPVYVESKSQYKKLCKERGLTARCLM